MRARAALGVTAATLAVAAGCVSLKRTPEARFFVLRSLAQPAAAPAQATQGFVGVLTARIPGHLDRPQLVTWTGTGELRIDEFLRWAEPLEAGFTRALTENLQALLPDHLVARAPWRGSVVPRCRVATELSVFGLQPNGEIRLEGRWALLPQNGELPLARGTSSFRRGPLSGAHPDAEVEAMSELIADLSRDIAKAALALPPVDAGAGDARR
jgi:uncharacterized protein